MARYFKPTSTITTTNSATGTASKYATAQAVAFIVDEISKNPQHVIQIKDKTKRMGKWHKANPRGKGILDLKSYSHSGTQPLSTQVGLVGTNLHHPYVNCRRSTEKHSVSGLIKHVNNRTPAWASEASSTQASPARRRTIVEWTVRYIARGKPHVISPCHT